MFQRADSRWNDDDLDEADEEKDEGGTGHVGSEPGVHLFGVLQETSTGQNPDIRLFTSSSSGSH